MNKNYLEPQLEIILLSHDDVLTASSGDNDAPFISVGGGTWIDDGWSKYY